MPSWYASSLRIPPSFPPPSLGCCRPVAEAAKAVYFEALQMPGASASHKGFMVKVHERRLGVAVRHGSGGGAEDTHPAGVSSEG